MGSNNRIQGQLAETRGDAARIEGEGFNLWGLLRAPGKAVKSDATAMIRLERVQLVDGPGDNRVQLPCITSMYLGDKWEYLFNRGGLRVRAYGREPLAPGEHWLQLAQRDLWIF
jgi:iron(III) transport system ATP-binding protein